MASEDKALPHNMTKQPSSVPCLLLPIVFMASLALEDVCTCLDTMVVVDEVIASDNPKQDKTPCICELVNEVVVSM